jgi:hypothetical protein
MKTKKWFIEVSEQPSYLLDDDKPPGKIDKDKVK